MQKLILATASAAALMLGGSFVSLQAQAAPMLNGLENAAPVSNVENVQFFFGAHRYCFYYDGWHGPGWYWCGYAYRRGFGWGGGEGFHGWVAPGRGGVRGRPGPGPGRPKGGGGHPALGGGGGKGGGGHPPGGGGGHPPGGGGGHPPPGGGGGQKGH